MALNALADTSLFIAMEQGRQVRSAPPSAVAVSVVTIGELRFGVLAATNPAVKAQRLRTLTWALSFDPLPVDDAVSTAWAELRDATRHRRPALGGNDSWIAATAIAHGLPLATQDADYENLPGLTVIKL
jgi:predicted nucleic acid-binding protein